VAGDNKFSTILEAISKEKCQKSNII